VQGRRFVMSRVFCCRFFLLQDLLMQYFTVAEVHRRLRAVKQYLMKSSNQRIKLLCVRDLPRIDRLKDYDALDEFNFLNATDITQEMFMTVVRENRQLFLDESNYRSMSLLDYANEYKSDLQNLFCFTCMCLCDRENNVLYKIIICLGSLHHAPRILYRNEKMKKVHFEKLLSYCDLR